MGAGAIGEQTQLLFLDAVLHLAAGAVDLVVELLGIVVEIGDELPGQYVFHRIFINGHPLLALMSLQPS